MKRGQSGDSDCLSSGGTDLGKVGCYRPFYSISDQESGLRGYVTIDSTVRGRCLGGLRISPDVSPCTLADLARVMTLKMGFLGLAIGGAKSAIIADPEMPLERKKSLLRAFGNALLPLLKSGYSVTPDMGTTGEDIRFMLDSLGLGSRRKIATDIPSLHVGLTVLAAATAAAHRIGLDMGRASIAIEGFGKIGSGVARAAEEKGLKVVAISASRGAIYRKEGLDLDELLKLYQQCGSRVVELYRGAEPIEKGELLELAVDVLSPCAGPHTIHSGNADRVRAKIISPGANIPTTPEAEHLLLSRGILSLPDFVANCGAVLGANMELAGLREGFIKRFIDERIGAEVTAMLQAAEKEPMVLREYAEGVAEQRFLQVKERAEKGSITNKAFYFTVGLRRKGLAPRYPTSFLARRYFKRRLA